jgi:exopolyphosphatase/guanosine-5'-triphosphate,3'-diphosphate pyrophosphatase
VTIHPAKLPESVAAVDLGSNSFHMLVARTGSGAPIVVDRIREMVQLASGLDENGRLGDEACERALDCLRKFGQRLHHMPPDAVRAVGTNTLRSARDSAGFLEAAAQALGHAIETISGIEEARLIFLGVAQTLPAPDTKRLVIDIGGGSTELIVGQNNRTDDMESLYMGSITISRSFFADGVIDSKRWKKAETAALQEIEPIRSRFADAGWSEAVGASGTIRAVHNLARTYGWSDGGVTPATLKKLKRVLLEAGKVSRIKLEGLNPKRVPHIAGGAAVLSALLSSLGIERLRRADGALREGLVHDLIGRFRAADVRNSSVESLADRYHVDWKQAAQVECAALQLLDQVAKSWRLTSQATRQFLTWAAQLHEIGLDIAHDHYHRHAQYIVANSDLLGFSRTEQQLLSTLVRAHRRKFPVAVLRELPKAWGKPAERIAILLRLAVVLHRSRSPDPLPTLKLKAAKKQIELRFPEGWLDEHPLTRADLETEAANLTAAGYRLGFS